MRPASARSGSRRPSTRYDGQIHAFFSLAGAIPTALEAIDESATHLRKAFAAR